MDALQAGGLIPQSDAIAASFCFACGQFYDSVGKHANSLDTYLSLLAEYPDYSRFAEVEAAILAIPTICERHRTLRNSEVSASLGFMPDLYYKCGREYEDEGKSWRALTMYEAFLADYPEHALASEMEAGLARMIVAEAKAAGAGTMPAPSASGVGAAGVAVVTIRNDSPERLRIAFSGPDARVEDLAACTSCRTYVSTGPLNCPEKGPVGTYRLEPGAYEVVVQSIGDSGVTPWRGDWSLGGGKEYYNCFFVVKTYSP